MLVGKIQHNDQAYITEIGLHSMYTPETQDTSAGPEEEEEVHGPCHSVLPGNQASAVRWP